ncbi:cuticle protein 18.7-like [Diprion similis]|uniref:cuticle protein 18.7-like n=1 Tax=Diprion similis TaxID=362088 RepID=UPI001EF7B9EB|nr:cuticle protein 18.7-like [Diprion similis]
MKCFIVFSALVAVALAKPGGLLHGVSHGAYVAPLAYAHLVAGAPTGPDGRVVDTPEVAHAKAEHAAAQVNERVTLAREASKNYVAGVVPAYPAYPAYSAYSAYSAPALAYGKVYSGVAPVVSAYGAYAPSVAYGAPLSLDGRVVDTPEVAVAKAAHFAAHAEAKARLGYAGHYAYAAPVAVW